MKVRRPQSVLLYSCRLTMAVLFVIAPVVRAAPSASATPASSASASSTSPQIIVPKPFYTSALDWLWNTSGKLKENLADKIVAAAAAGAVTLAGVSWKYARKRAHSVFFDFPGKARERGHLIMLLGETASGKTTFIKQAFSYPAQQTGAPNPRRATADIGVYTVLHETKTKVSTQRHRYDLVDYRGHNPGQIAAEWDRVVKDLKFKFATAVILVIDIFGAGYEQREQNYGNRDEISRLVAYWKGCLDTLAGKIGRSPEMVVLFVNKLDLLKGVPMRSIVEGGGSRIPVIKRELSPLVDVLKTTFGGLEVDVIAGSLLYGVGVNDLLAKLREVSPDYPQ